MENLKVAFIGISHWHFPLYVSSPMPAGCEIVAVSDPVNEIAVRMARQLNCKGYVSHIDLMEKENPDFIFIFGQHNTMSKLAGDAIERGIPFSIEKPAGMNASDVASLAQRATDERIFASAALVYRLSHELRAIDSLGENISNGPAYMSFRQFGGPPERYLRNGNPWMLDPSKSGGGCLINLGVHFIDMALALGGGFSSVLSGHVNAAIHNASVEDYASVQLLLSSGGSAIIEVGYTMPTNDVEQREMTISFANRAGFVRTVDDGLVVHHNGGRSNHIRASLETDGYFELYRNDVLDRFLRGKAPLASLGDLSKTMEVVDAVYSMNRNRIDRGPQ
jgi:predicted dehydrogenase